MEPASTNSETIEILVLEDNQEDSALCLRKLKVTGLNIHADVVRTPFEFVNQLDVRAYDVVLADSRLPDWSALSTLHLMESRGRRIPLIVIADGLGDELASECIRVGASDYVLKQDLDRLPVVLWRVITEQKLRQDRDRAERELRESEEQYRLLFEANPNPMWVCDIGDLCFLAVNDAAVAHYGYSRDEFLSMTVGDVHPEEIPFIERQDSSLKIPEALSSREVWKHVKKNGVTIDVEISSQAILFRGHKALLVLAHDITAVRNAEAALRESREQLQLLLDSSAEAIFGLDLNGACTFCNAAAIRMLGYDSAQALLGQHMHSKMHGKRADGSPYPEAECYIYRALRAGMPAHSGDEVYWRADGTSFPVEYWSHPVVRDEVVVGAVVTFFDITQKKKAEEALRRTEAQHQSIIEGAPYGIYRAHSNGNLLMVNPALVILLGYESEAELLQLGACAAIYCRPEDRVCQQEKYSSGRDTVGVEATLKRKDGGHLTVRLSGRRIHSEDEQTTGYEVFVENITEQRHLERQLLQAQKMEAVGQLAGGVAHDFNNLLMVINGFAQLILDSANDPTKISQYATQITEAGTKAASVTKQLLAFSRSQVQDLRVLDLNLLVADLYDMLPRFLGEDVEMVFSASREPSLVRADQAQIEQVLMNLVLNARDAMPKGGRVTIAADRVHLDQTYFSSRDVQTGPGNYIMLSVTDTGCGMDEATRARVFEPFFTTKERGKGTGLGLATVYGIVKQSAGFVWVYSEPGQGTAFKVYLPEAEGMIPAASKSAVTEKEPVGSETILVVEDEKGIRDVTCDYLHAKGYQVLQASNPAEALQMFSQAKERIHLMLTDMIMPGGNGPELAATVRSMGRHLPVIFMSGYADRSLDGETLGSDAIFLQKPFSLATLARAVRSALKEESEVAPSG
jgi:two-component system cell cycle sensor histidine kinase/response regulator CckA